MVATQKLESERYSQGHLLVCGIDEVGRGSLAGPLVAASVILPVGFTAELDDSKKLSKKIRADLSQLIKQQATAYGLGWVSNDEIDSFGLTNSVQLAYIRALEEMNAGFSHLIIDGNYDYLSSFGVSETLIAADSKVACVAAASILAKVERDNFMIAQAENHPAYGFESNVGYGTKKHLGALSEKGLSRLHRRSFCRRYL